VAGFPVPFVEPLKAVGCREAILDDRSLVMTLPRTVADVLSRRVTLEVGSIDRMYLNLYVPRLQHVNGVVWFFRGHRGEPFASSALMDPISKTFIAGIHRFRRDHGVPMIDFARASARMTWRTSTWAGSPAPRGCCSSPGQAQDGSVSACS
jgi:hypothetical protein